MSTSTQMIDEGRNQMNNLQFSLAEKSFETALNQNPRSVGARIGLAQISFVKGEPTQAVNFINEALEIQPENAEAMALKGVSEMQKQNWQEAVSYLEKAREKDPSLQMSYVNLAKCYRKLGKLKEAELAATKAIELNPENYQAHLQLSGVLFKTDRTKEGIEEVVEALRINPLYIKGYLLIGRLFQASGQFDQAIRIYEQGLKFNPLATPLREELAGVYAFQGDFENAYKESVSIALLQDSDADWLRVGVISIALGQFEKAEKAFQKTLTINPDNGEAHYNLGELYFAAKLYQKAAEHYMMSIERDGKNFQPFNGLGMLHLMVNRNAEESKKCFVRALELSPGQKEPMLNMALACALNQEYKIAMKFAHATLEAAKAGDGIYEQAERLIAEIETKQ